MEPYLVDIAVLLIFFNRPDHFRQVFEQVKKARPSRLYLSCDGARADNQSDIEKINECKKIAEEIDWTCEVFKNYSEVNLGCGRGPKAGIDFLFQHEEYGIILEDDCIPSVSFFPFCKEVLEVYKNDRRVFCITGINAEKESLDCPDSYFFGYSGTNWGWATWKRNWIDMDYALSFVEDPYTLSLMRNKNKQLSGKKGLKEVKTMIATNQRVKNGENISYWDVQWQTGRYLNHQLAIIPAKNMITNIGVGADSTHAQTMKKNETAGETVGKISFLFNKRYEIDFPLKHPKYMIPNTDYDRRIDRFLYPSFFIRAKNKLKQQIHRWFRR